MSQLQYRNESQNFISNFVFQFIKKTKRHFGNTYSVTSLKKGHHHKCFPVNLKKSFRTGFYNALPDTYNTLSF